MTKNLLVGLSLFIGFFAYFSFTAYHLPSSAGPDEHFSRVATDFYHQHNRMATVAEDEDKMVFSKYGNTRLLRPPLGFYLPAIIAKVPGINQLPRAYAYRLANALFGAATVLACFVALLMYFRKPSYAVYGSLVVGLIPQFGFYSSYLNDDSAALFAAALLTLAMVNIVRNGVSTKSCIFFTAAVGLTVLTKQTAWIYIGGAILFYLIFILRFNQQFVVQHVWMLAAFIVAGGWWFLFNMYHYGLGEFMLSGTGRALVEKYATYQLDDFGFKAKHNLEMRHLLILNRFDFIGASYKAFIGHLDWLRLRVGSLQYSFYLWVVVAVAVNAILLSIQTAKVFLLKQQQLTKFERQQALFEWVLYVAVLIQILLYTWHNVYRDIQVQGKYLMPVLLPLMILALSGVQRVLTIVKNKVDCQFSPKVTFLILLIIFTLPIIVHLDALIDHVIPFYWPDHELNPILNWLF